MSHRFIRFIAKENCSNLKKRIEDYIKFVYDNEKATMKYHKITEDTDMYDGQGKVIFSANPKGMTIMLVCEVP